LLPSDLSAWPLTLASSPRSRPRPCLMSAKSAEIRTRRLVLLVAIESLQVFAETVVLRLRGNPEVDRLVPQVPPPCPPRCLAELPQLHQRVVADIAQAVSAFDEEFDGVGPSPLFAASFSPRPARSGASLWTKKSRFTSITFSASTM